MKKVSLGVKIDLGVWRFATACLFVP